MTRNASRYDVFSIRLTEQLTPRNRVSFSQENQYRCQGSTLTENGEGCRARAGTGSRSETPPTQGVSRLPRPALLRDAGDLVVSGLEPVAPRCRIIAVPLPVRRQRPGAARRAHRSDSGHRAVQHLRARELQLSRALRSERSRLCGQQSDLDPVAVVGRMSAARTTSRSATWAPAWSRLGRVANDSQLRYTFNNRSPISFGYVLAPRWDTTDHTMTAALFAQDQWTLGKLTLQGAIRYDRAWSWAPAEGNGTTETSIFNPQPISFERTVSVKGYNDITPRMGAAYDVFGTGKTALKANLGKPQERRGRGVYAANNPAVKTVTRVTARPWTDGNRNFRIDCNLSNPGLQDNLASGGDRCAALGGNDLNFGNPNPNLTTIDPAILEGWGVRESDWQFGVSVQQEVLPRVGVRSATTGDGSRTSSSRTTC